MSLTALSSGFLAPTEDDTWAPPSLTNRCAMASPNAAVSAADDCNLASQSRTMVLSVRVTGSSGDAVDGPVGQDGGGALESEHRFALLSTADQSAGRESVFERRRRSQLSEHRSACGKRSVLTFAYRWCGNRSGELLTPAMAGGVARMQRNCPAAPGADDGPCSLQEKLFSGIGRGFRRRTFAVQDCTV